MSTNGDDDLAEFLADVKVRRPKAEVAQVAPKPEATTEEDNAANAAMGFGFKCSVCGRSHRRAVVGTLKVLDKCIEKAFERTDGALVPRKEPVNFVTSSDVYSQGDTEWWPDNYMWRLAYPDICKEYEAAHKTLRTTLQRTVTTTVPVMAVLSAPNFQETLKAHVERHHAQVQSAEKDLRREVSELYAPIKAQVKGWRQMPLDGLKFSDKNVREITRMFRGTYVGDVHPISYITINKTQTAGHSILHCFKVVEPQKVSIANDTVETELYDIGYRSGDLAILYAHSQYGGSRRKPKLRSRTFWVSTWKGTTHYVADWSNYCKVESVKVST